MAWCQVRVGVARDLRRAVAKDSLQGEDVPAARDEVAGKHVPKVGGFICLLVYEHHALICTYPAATPAMQDPSALPAKDRPAVR